MPAPTYLVGVDEIGEKLYIIAVRKRQHKRLHSMTTRHESTTQTLRILWTEVKTSLERA